ncbi:sensor histidine kinase [Algoriphagus chordae]|uniref:histidine kinase n=1 Tax=Algoriphagus chordae TaxID=237019 RepID=A0A2W7RIC0_9BACT|nr:sensor histidine kinase [Algoriphagus chordae]PZX58120.1 two component regulator with propeller domain [Algoriphagus chordae]
MKQFYHISTYFICLCWLLLVSACQQNHEVAFPENPSDYQNPEVKPFEMPKGKPLTWNVIHTEDLPIGVDYPIDFDKLPSRPFFLHDFKPLKSPIYKTSMNWDAQPEIPYQLDTITGQTVNVKKQILEQPVISKLGTLGKSELGSTGILRVGQTEGLLGTQIYALVQDNNGMIWISTDRGISKFTGDQFENYNVIPRNPDGLIDIIGDLELTQDGNLLMLSNLSGLYELDLESGIIHNYQIGSQYARLYEDKAGLIWLGKSGDSPYFLDRTTKKLHHIWLPEEMEAGSTIGVFVDAQDNVLFGMKGKVGVFNPERTSIKILQEGFNNNSTDPFYDFSENTKGEIWLSSFSGEAIGISLEKREITRLGKEQGFNGVARSVTFDLHDRVWITDNDTLTIYNPSNQQIKKIITNAKFNTSGFPSATLTDQKGNVWVGTDRAGILLIDPDGMFSEHFSTINGLASNEVWGIKEGPKGKIWMATYEGINVYDPEKDRIFLLKFSKEYSRNDHRSVSIISDNEILVGSYGGFVIINVDTNIATVYKLDERIARITWKALKDAKGNIWLGSDDGVLIFNPEMNSLKKTDDFSGLSSSRVWLIEFDSENRAWLGNDIGVDVIDSTLDKVSYISAQTGLTSDYTSILLQTKRGEMIVGSDSGMSIFDLQKNTITNLTPSQGLIPPVMYDLVEVGKDLHIGSDNGIIVAKRPREDIDGDIWRFYNFGKREGFPFNDYNQATATYTSKGNVWWGAAPIMTVNLQKPKTDSIPPKIILTHINIMDQNPSFLGSDFVRTKITDDDTLWNTDHTVYYTKKDIPKDSSYLIQKNITWDSVDMITKMPIGLVLPYDQNSMNFSFMNPNVQGRDKIVYRYILEGEDKNWSNINSRSTTQNYYNLLPGEYTFKVASRGFNGLWSEPASFKFTISPPWWQTWVAYVIFASLVAGFIYLIVQLRSKYLQKENRILEERVTHRTAQLKKSIDELKNAQSQLVQSEKMASLGELTAGIAHEIQNPLNFVNNFSELSSELIDEMREELENGDIDEAKAISVDVQQNLDKINQHGKRADAIVKAMLQHSRVSGGNRVSTDVNMLADEFLRLAYHGLRAKDKSFNSSMKTDFDPNVGNMDLVAQELGRVLLNLINNAFYAVTDKKSDGKEGYEPLIEVSTKKLTDWVEIKVKDNGKGIPKSVVEKIFQPFFTTKPTGKGTGLGLSISYDIVKAHGGEIIVESKEGEGTEFCVRLPIDAQ